MPVKRTFSKVWLPVLVLVNKCLSRWLRTFSKVHVPVLVGLKVRKQVTVNISQLQYPALKVPVPVPVPVIITFGAVIAQTVKW